MTQRAQLPGCLMLTALLAAGGSALADDDHGAHGAELLEQLGLHHHGVTTSSEEAQKFFDQGLTLAYAFNHEEAADSFREATRLDPECAMGFWGIAYVLGPNINAPLNPAAHPEIRQALERARELAPKVTERERAYIEAMSVRYGDQPVADRSALDKAYADAMRRVALRFPDDLDAATLFAEALMDTSPWDYWTEEGEAKPITREFIRVLETVLRRKNDHLGANHFLIHAVEKVEPELAVEAAENLEGAARGAGHLVHMASHIYIRVGRYADASRVNEEAVAADAAYAEKHGMPPGYAGSYALHNEHFLSASAGFEGRSALSLETARTMAAKVDTEAMREPSYGTGQHFSVTPLFTQVRFGRWDEILETPEPAADLAYPRGVWRFASGLAQVRKGNLDRAQDHLDALRLLAGDRSLEPITIWEINGVRSLLEIAEQVLAGELAAARGEYVLAVRLLEKGVELEQSLIYDEPPPWNIPVRQNLGAVLLAASRPEAAEQVYRDDLAVYPWNGWSLFGLAQALEAQGRAEEAAQVRQQFARSWQRADVELVASRF